MRRRYRLCLAVLGLTACWSVGDSAGAAAADTNLLSYANGTIVRAYTRGLTDVARLADGSVGMDEGTKGPIQLVYELPGVATLSGVVVTLESSDVGEKPVTATVAVSTTSATAGFRDLGSAHSTPKGDPQTVPGTAGVQARWIRVTASVSDAMPPLQQIVATGTLAPRPPNAPPLAGDFWAFGDKLNESGGVLGKPADEIPEHLEVTQVGAGMNGMQCSTSAFVTAFPGRLDGRTWTYVAEAAGNDFRGRLVVNDEGTVVVGSDEGGAMRAFVRTSGGPLPAYCVPEKHGAGAAGVLVLNSPHWDLVYPFADKADLVRFKTRHFTIAGAPLLTPALLTGVETVVLNGICRAQFMFNTQQTAALMDWVAAGHKVLITDSDMCADIDHPTRYDFLPYKFISDNPGAKGATGHNLVVVEDDTLGTAEKSDAEHFVDAEAYASNTSNELGDANTVVTQDDHWCGHLFGTNANSVNGFMQMYAIHGRGLIIFDGLDTDDAARPEYQTIRRLEYEQPIPPALPCSRRVDSGFVIVSDQSRTFVPGKAATITVPLSVYTNRGWKGHVALSATGDFHAAVTPAAFDMPADARAVSVAIDVPATVKAGHYAIVVKGSGTGGQQAQATISLSTAETKETLRSALDSGCKVAVYGVNFDFNKATLRGDAEPVLQQILALFKDDLQLAAEIGGHTDNVGTPAYNLTLSGGRSDAVKAWLIAHGVAASRLTTKGYGDTVPLVPNDSDASRAKNRRVELKKANCDR